jgi:DNA-binding transcriptional regulator YdaS (Cro superfamily)
MKLDQYIKNTTQSEFATLIGVSQGMIYQWLKGIRPVSLERCPSIEKATDGKVTCEELRPDVDWAFLRGTSKRVKPNATPRERRRQSAQPKVL